MKAGRRKGREREGKKEVREREIGLEWRDGGRKEKINAWREEGERERDD